MKEKTYVEDVNRSIYDIRNEEKDVYRVKEGLTPDSYDISDWRTGSVLFHTGARRRNY